MPKLCTNCSCLLMLMFVDIVMGQCLPTLLPRHYIIIYVILALVQDGKIHLPGDTLYSTLGKDRSEY